MEQLLQNLFEWISLHPYAFNGVVFVVALMESLVVLGLLIPGAALLFGVGALMATGSLPILSILLWTVAGAIVGDLISFLLGQYYHQRLRVVWPFRRYPRLVNRGVDFFVRHGGKSVFMARFIGPLRPIVPAIAGMMNMTTPRFLLVDSIACILWAPVYILPGMVFGASLGLAAEVAGRLVVLLVLIAAVAWLGIWLISNVVRLLRPHAGIALEKTLDWSRTHPLIRPLAGSLLDPGHPEARGLAILSALLFVTLWLLLLITSQTIHGHALNGTDTYLFHSLQDLRTPWADSATVFLTQLGNQALLVSVLAGSCAWLFWKGYTKAAWHWIAVYIGTGLLTWTLKLTLRVERPQGLLEGFSFPSAHTSMSLAVYGFLALMVARELPLRHRWLPYTLAGLLVMAVAMSRLYLGVHWFSDVLAGLTLGIFWVALIGIAYDRHPAPPLPVRRLLVTVTLLVALACAWQTQTRFAQELADYRPQTEIHRISRATWKAIGWEALPAYRVDLQGRNEQPMNFQWAGSLATLREVLLNKGWHEPTSLTPLSAMNWLAPDPDIATLPVLPQVNDGQHQVLLLTGPQAAGEQRLVALRLWPSDRELTEDNTPVWVGNVVYLYREQEVPLITYLRVAADFDTPLDLLVEGLSGVDTVGIKLLTRQPADKQVKRKIPVLLGWESAAASQAKPGNR
jgi:membrane protein DedA with SNARE-associated domain/membrane-associated phospholipid phosphatase